MEQLAVFMPSPTLAMVLSFTIVVLPLYFLVHRPLFDVLATSCYVKFKVLSVDGARPVSLDR